MKSALIAAALMTAALALLLVLDERTTADGVSGTQTTAVEPIPPLPPEGSPPTPAPLRPKRSRAVGRPFAGRLVGGVQLAAEGRSS
jgi:hypothetical protein